MVDNILVRGDTATLSFPIESKDGSVINISDIKTIFLTCRMIPKKSSKILIKKNKDDFRFEDGKYKVDLKSEDTQSFESLNDKKNINFDIEVTLNNGTRKTGIFSIPFEYDYTIHGVNEQIEALNSAKVYFEDGNLIFEYDDEILKLNFSLENGDLIVENNITELDFNINEDKELEVVY